jgi:hypothetical protein
MFHNEGKVFYAIHWNTGKRKEHLKW